VAASSTAIALALAIHAGQPPTRVNCQGMDLDHRPRPYQLVSGDRLIKIRQVGEGARQWMRLVRRGPVVVTWCCQPLLTAISRLGEHREEAEA
jgi:hypothetical protein